MTRQFAAKPAVRESVPLLVGLMGPSGGGKTYSALRLASGIQSVTGGKIYVIDTEARRALHYADQFEFEHVQFDAPFGSLDYLAAIEFCVKQGAKVIVIDSMSHEHSGVGGMIEFQERELDRLAGSDYAKRERVKMLAWQKPKAARRKLIDRVLQMNANFIFCFRAKETVKPIKVGGKTEIVPMGFMPIAGDEFTFEQTINMLLLPNAGGVPTWQSDNTGEKQMMKLPQQFRELFAKQRPLDEETGRALANWAKGGAADPTPRASAAPSVGAGEAPAPAERSGETATVTSSERAGLPSAGAGEPQSEDDTLKQLDQGLAEAAAKGMAALQEEWASIAPRYQKKLKVRLDRFHKPDANKADQEQGSLV